MKAYGDKKKDAECCPGHNKFSGHSYNRRSIKAKSRDTKYAHSRERSSVKITTLKEATKPYDDESDKFVPEDQYCTDYCCTLRGTEEENEILINRYVINN